MAIMTPEERKSRYFSSLEEGAVLTGKVVEYLSSDIAIVEINGFLIRSRMEKRVSTGKTVHLKVLKKDFRDQQLVLKIIS